MARKYARIELIGKEILEMREEGKTKREIGERLGISKEQVKNFISRYNRKQSKVKAGIALRMRGRPAKGQQKQTSEAEKDYEIKRLRMENQLLRDFLRECGRGRDRG